MMKIRFPYSRRLHNSSDINQNRVERERSTQKKNSKFNDTEGLINDLLGIFENPRKGLRSIAKGDTKSGKHFQEPQDSGDEQIIFVDCRQDNVGSGRFDLIAEGRCGQSDHRNVNDPWLESVSLTNPLQWIMHGALPRALLPDILSFAGPQTAHSLSLTSKMWRRLVKDESVWKVMSVEMNKWNVNDDIPQSWFHHYCLNPSVPLDYKSMDSAICGIDRYRSKSDIDQVQNFRILLSPDIYMLDETLDVSAKSYTLTVETTCERSPKKYESSFDSSQLQMDSLSDQTTSSARTFERSFSRSRLHSLCRSHSVFGVSSPRNRKKNVDLSLLSTCDRSTRAVLILKSNHRNVPVVRVSRGNFNLKRVDIIHGCEGIDIWNGNAAVQIQPLLDDNGAPTTNEHQPTAVLTEVGIASVSGRGIVAIDGGTLITKNCLIQNCAATGVYIGGPGSNATMEYTDVFNCGHGNQTKSRGVARGHSGVYLEQGVTVMRNCNISKNSLTGISAISQDNATLNVEDSDVVGNGSIQIELPRGGSASHRRCTLKNNVTSKDGCGRLRSGLVCITRTRTLSNSDSVMDTSIESTGSDTSSS